MYVISYLFSGARCDVVATDVFQQTACMRSICFSLYISYDITDNMADLQEPISSQYLLHLLLTYGKMNKN